MAQVGKYMRRAAPDRMLFFCPGCEDHHAVKIGVGPGPRWVYNHKPEAPTFEPSILVTWSEPSDVEEEFDDPSKDKKMVCHSFVREGKIQFLNDCTHPLAGQTVPLPEINA